MLTNSKRVKKFVKSWIDNRPKRDIPPLTRSNIFRAYTGSLRVLPDFLIIGAVKCGTTSLYDDLIMHPSIIPAVNKEVFFFDSWYYKEINWYRAHFCSKFQKFFKKSIQKRSFLTGEATPTTIFYPLAPKRVKSVVPNAKLIVLLRNPVDRAYSHYHMEVRRGKESLSFEAAIEKEDERLSGEFEKIFASKTYYSFPMEQFSYKLSGIYVEQLKNWFKIFPKNQILILRTEDFSDHQLDILNQVLEFLELPRFSIQQHIKNIGSYKNMKLETRKKLIDFFRPHNERLYSFLDRNFEWDH